MARCNNASLLAKIGVKQITKDMEVDFTVMSTLPDCKRINARAYSSIMNADGAIPTYSGFTKPANQFECMGGNCVNSGTLFPGVSGAEIVYHAPFNAVDFAQGLITFYTKGATSVTVKISSDAELTNADSYTITPGAAGADGFSPVIVDLSATPTTIGEGWEPSETGVFFSITATGTANEIGISSIAIFDEKEDFETNAVVKISCLTDISGDIDIDAAEETCWTGGYDTDDLTFERTITGKALTPNYWLLNPLLGRGTAKRGFEITSVERVISADGGYGKITLSDMYQNECRFVGIALADNCDVTEGMLVRLNVPSVMAMNENHFIVVPGENNLTDIYFNSALVGQTVVVSYPKEVAIEELVADVDNVGTRQVSMSYVETQTDGTKWVYVYDNVLVTTFPQSLTEDETEFEFTINIKKGKDGHYYRKYRIL